ncbi:MAG: peptidase C14 caspase catalytic subunit p20 [Gammaproteobacteria bacterium]|nr:MAG: peptidase C14 caspase catalytic subunit p20 [Gammaproteobacteria bacterium]
MRRPPTRPARRHRLAIGLGAALAGLALGGPVTPAVNPRSPAAADELFVIDCLLPGQIRQLGQRTTYLSPRRPVRTSARDCQIRGGEYVAWDRADLRSSLAVWLPAAKAGEVEAMTVVGEMFEKGLGVPADHAAAAQWYRKAADLGALRAQVNLGHLYEQGLGVPRDPAEALRWYRRAAGLPDVIELDAGAPIVRAAPAEPVEQAEALRREMAGLQRETEMLREAVGRARLELDAAQAALEQAQAEQQALRAAADAASGAAAAELDRRAAEGEQRVRTISESLRQREVELARHQADRTRLLGELEGLQQTSAAQAQRIAELEHQLAPAPAPPADLPVAGPALAIIEPQLLATRGITVVAASAGAVEGGRRIVGRVTAPAGLLHLAVNDAPVEPNDSGVFTAQVAGSAGDTPVTIVAVDRRGQRAAVEFVLRGITPATAGPATASPATEPAAQPWAGIDFGRYHALVIGNNDYRHLPDLKSAVNDAREVAALLEKRYGFAVTVLQDADRYTILAALNKLRERLTAEDNLLIYYAGHGELDEVNSRGHWLPVDAEPGSTANWIPTTAITDILNILKAKQVLLVVDSCYAGALTRSSMARLATGATDAERLHWLRAVSQKRSRTVLTSGGLEPVLDAGGGEHSVFARALLEVLRSNAEVLDGQGLHREVAARVSYAAGNVGFDQVPEYAPVRYAGHEAGEFFLVPRL